MHPSYVDIENEFSEIGVEVDHLSARLARLNQHQAPADMQDKWEATVICASAAEKIYTGCERVMARLATEVDGTQVAHADGWHMALLRRMARPFPGVRGPIISGECYSVLDRLRAFRHRERNTYGINLDFGIVVERAAEAVAGFELFRAQVRAFFERRDDDTEGKDEAPVPNSGPGIR